MAGTLAAWPGSLAAQEMVLPTHEVPSPEVAAEVLRRDQERAGLVKFGPFDITPSVQSSLYYDDNVDTRAGDRIEDFVLTLAPRVSASAVDMEAGMGKRMDLRYTPYFYFYFDESDLNTVDHSASVSGAIAGAKLSLGFSQVYRRTTDPVIDIGTRADRSAYDTTLTSSYALGEKTALEINGALDVIDYDEAIYTGAWDLSNNDWIRYQYSPKLSLALGVVIGYTAIEDNADQSYQQLLARANFAIAEKVSLSASAGGEWRQFRSGADDALTPVWRLGAAYRPRESTVLTLTLYQQYLNSALQGGGQSYTYTGVTFGARQMLLQRLALNLSTSYSLSDYESTVAGIQVNRRDNLFLIRASLDTYVMQRWTVGAFYNYQTRNSNDSDYDFDRSRVGVQTAWTF